MKILLVEPLFERAKVISQKVIASEGAADHVLSAAAALDKLAAGYDGLIVSSSLPDMSGGLLMKIINGQSDYRELKGIVVTSPESDALVIDDFFKTLAEEKAAAKSKEQEAKK